MWMCHTDVSHLTVNTFGWLVFGVIILLGHGPKTLLALSLFSSFWVGLTCWFTSGEKSTCGASGIIFCWFFFVICVGLMKVLGPPPNPGCPPKGCSCMATWCRGCMCTPRIAREFLVSLAVAVVYGSL